MLQIADRAAVLGQKFTNRVQGKLEKWMMHLYGKDLSSAACRAALHLIVQARAGLILLHDTEPGRAQIWRGFERSSGQPLCVAFVGDARAYSMRSPQYLKRRLFNAEEIVEEDAGPVTKFGARKAAAALAKKADLVIVEGSHLLHWQPKVGEWRSFPTSVHMVLRFPQGHTWEQIESRMHLHKRKIKTAHRNGLTLDPSKSEDDFDIFYDRMYIPMMEERHPGYGVIHPKESLRSQFQYGQLMLVRDPSGQAIGGGLFCKSKHAAFLLHTGLLDGDPAWYDYGASSALYYHTIRSYFEADYRLYDAGGCRAFTSDGLYEFKRRWGMEPVPDLWNPRDWLFWVPSGSPTALTWLRAQERIPII